MPEIERDFITIQWVLVLLRWESELLREISADLIHLHELIRKWNFNAQK